MLVGVWLIPAIAVIAIVIHLALARRPWPKGRILEVCAVHVIVWGLGIGSLFSFYSMVAEPLASRIALELGWAPGNPFQKLQAVNLLTIAVLGILSIWFRGAFWLLTVVLALLEGSAQILVVQLNKVPTVWLWVDWVYSGFVVWIALALLIAYRVRAGPDRFWAPTIGATRRTLEWRQRQLR
jgi:hypothetical protein